MKEAHRTYPLETGGVLLGWFAKPWEAVVTALVGPGPEARHEAASFRPDADWQQERIAASYRASGRTVTYLGDWHTHPNGRLSLSRADVATLRTIASHKAARVPNPLMAVLAGGPDWGAGLWQLTHRRCPVTRSMVVVPFGP